MKFKEIVNLLKNQLGPYIKNVQLVSKNRCLITTNYFYPDRTHLEIIAREIELDKIKFSEEGKLFELITGDRDIRYSGHGMEKMKTILSLTRDVQRHFYIDETIPECFTLGILEEHDNSQDLIKAFYHLMAVCLIIGHLNINVEEIPPEEDENDE